ncbi:GntR family transcriptional regulator [Actinomadura sp. B10D3]|uniref:FadR/GntR family transcriptional regulator n=1 Tax=Actinomadura sp. B10D3 TaxID=3153557 RepID=UPI00325F6204
MGVVTGQFAPIPSDRLHERVAQQLRNAILDGSYQPGDRLPSERELTDLFQVSRSAVRQALLLLQQQGLITVRQGNGGGAFVSGRRMDPLLHAFENLFALQGITVDQFLAAKAVLEPAISTAAATNADADDLAALKENLESCEQALAEGRPIAQHLLDFHLIFAAATHNPILELVLTALVRIADRLPTAPEEQTEDWEGLLESHRAIYKAMTRRSVRTVHRMTSEHLQQVWGETAVPSRGQ